MSHAGTLGTTCASEAAKANEKLAADANTIRGTVADVAKGQNRTHIGFHWGTGSFMKNHTHFETPLYM